jgi:membrane dipeptidase
MDVERKIERLHKEAPLADVHVHPSLKQWLFDRNLWKTGTSTSFFYPFSTRSSFPRLEAGGFRVIWATHHVPELELVEDNRLVRWASKITSFYSKLTKGNAFNRLNEMMTLLEDSVSTNSQRAEIVRSMDDLRNAREKDKIAVVHAVEGGHVIGDDLSRLETLSRKGIVSLTLTHFFSNQLAESVDGIPDNRLLKQLGTFETVRSYEEPLTPLGKAVLERMSKLSILPDITHMTPSARSAIYRHLPPASPVVATHVGIHEINPDPMNLMDDELEEIARRNGTVGLIFSNYWLEGTEPGQGLPALWKSLEHIYDVTGSWEHVMIGTDFDGFTIPPHDLQDASRIHNFTRMLLRKGLPEDAIKKILGGNVLRMMKDEWHKDSPADDHSETERNSP